jgi:NAD(P)-dependent dehydrogenase (short-subunit alcohol dehydrogenase family)
MGMLDGKVAVISGGTSGIGARAAELFVNGRLSSWGFRIPGNVT